MTAIGFVKTAKPLATATTNAVGGLQTSRTGLNVASEVEGGNELHCSLELFLVWVVRVVHRTVVTKLARRNNGFTPGKRSRLEK